jgi:predicted HicB family RNase H-like nuclease
MPTKPAPTSLPLTFDLPVTLHDGLVALQKRTGAESLSVLVRHILESTHLEALVPEPSAHRQLSVRVPRDVRLRLTKLAKTKKISTGELMRLAIAQYKAPKAKR